MLALINRPRVSCRCQSIHVSKSSPSTYRRLCCDEPINSCNVGIAFEWSRASPTVRLSFHLEVHLRKGSPLPRKIRRRGRGGVPGWIGRLLLNPLDSKGTRTWIPGSYHSLRKVSGKLLLESCWAKKVCCVVDLWYN